MTICMHCKHKKIEIHQYNYKDTPRNWSIIYIKYEDCQNQERKVQIR